MCRETLYYDVGEETRGELSLQGCLFLANKRELTSSPLRT